MEKYNKKTWVAALRLGPERTMMLARCPKNYEHKTFVTVAHVTEYWLVDEHGNFIEVDGCGGGEVLTPPDAGNIWTCAKCGVEASLT